MARRRRPLTMPSAEGPRGMAAIGAGSLAGLAALLAASQSAQAGGIPRLALTLAMWVVYAGGAWAVSQLSSRRALWLAVGGGAVLQTLALRIRPWTTDDFRRYVWDGRVQAAGINPYRYAPEHPQLAFLRDLGMLQDVDTIDDAHTIAAQHPHLQMAAQVNQWRGAAAR